MDAPRRLPRPRGGVQPTKRSFALISGPTAKISNAYAGIGSTTTGPTIHHAVAAGVVALTKESK